MGSSPPSVHYVSLVPGDGYGNAARDYGSVLAHLGVPVEHTALGWDQIGRTGDPVAADTLLVHLPPPELAAQVAHLGSGSYRRVVGMAACETDRVPERWADAVSGLDALAVPSTANAAAFAAAGVEVPIHVVPHTWIPRRSPPAFEHALLGDRFVFYAIGPWTTRKAHGETVAVFLDAFGAADDVALVLVTGAVDHQAVPRTRSAREQQTWWTLAHLLAGHRDPPPVLLLNERLTDAEIDACHVRGDCHLALGRGEGFGLTLFDAALAGTPVIATGWGGPLDFLGDDHPLLVRHEMVALADDVPDGWIEPSAARWARADHDHAVDLLRWVAAHRDEARHIGEVSRARARERFDVDAVATRLAVALGAW